MAYITCLYKLEVEGKIYRLGYLEMCMKFGVLSEDKVCFGAAPEEGGVHPQLLRKKV